MFFPGNSHLIGRRWPRIPIHVPVELVLHQRAYADRLHATGSALNEGGMCLLAVREMHLGAQVAVEFTPPLSDELLRLWAAVRDRRGYHYGVEFLAENTVEKVQVQRYRDALRLLHTAKQRIPPPS